MKLSPVEIPARPKGLRVEALALADPHFTADAQTGVIEIFDSIGEPGTTPARISAALRAIGARPVTIRLNSPGGNVFDGLTIFNPLRDHGAGVTVEILGIAASAASIVAMGGDEIRMARASEIMVHRAAGAAMGNADTFRQMVTVLDQVDGILARVYAQRTGMPDAEISRLMADETFLTAEEAIDMGFADGLLQRDAAAAPRLSASTAPRSKREWEDHFRQLGLSRSAAARQAALAWNAGGTSGDEPQIDLDAIAAAVTRNFSTLNL